MYALYMNATVYIHAYCIVAPTYFSLCLPIIFFGYFYEIWVGYDVGDHVGGHLYIYKTKKEHFNKKLCGYEYTVFLIPDMWTH